MFNKVFVFILALSFSAVVQASPEIQHWTTDNGARVYYVQATELPMVDVKVVFNAGAARDGDKSGVALMTSAMLEEGSGKLDADDIAAAFADVGAKLSATAERDMAVVSLRTLTESDAYNQAVNTFVKVLAQPSFPQDAFDRIQQQMLIGLQAEKQSPNAVAARAFYNRLYGEHAYASMPEGTTASVKLLQRRDLQAFYDEYYVSNNAVVVIVGDVNEQQAKQLATKITQKLAVGQKAPPIAPVSDIQKAKKVSVSHSSSQTTILMGQTGLSRDDPDYFPLYVGNHILGGSGLVSLLSDELREKRGLTYGVYSYFRPMLRSGPYIFSVQTRNEKAEEALTVMQDTLRQFIITGPTQAQLDAAKQNITGGFALRVDSNSKIADYLAMIGFYGLSLDYLDNFNDKVNAVTVAQIKTAYERRIHADKMVTVMVGGKAK